MSTTTGQLLLFESQSLNPCPEIKRTLRLALSRSALSRDEIVDRVNSLAVQEGLRKSISRAVLDSWVKDSDPDRLPSQVWMTLLCKVLEDPSPIAAMLKPLGFAVVDERGKKLLTWAEAEISRRKATRRAKHALATIEDF